MGLVTLPLFLWSQDSEHYETLASALVIYTNAQEQGDFEKLLTLTHPAIIQVGGGKDMIKQELESEKVMYNQLNLRLVNINTKDATKIVPAGDEWHALVPYSVEYDQSGNIYKEENFYLAASQDQGESWYFVDFKKYDPESIKLFIPNYNERLNIFLKTATH
jgi:hypothetical protein